MPEAIKYTHLHVHSHYSLLDGLGKIDDLIDRAKELGMDSIALTDHGVMYGAVELFIKAKEKGIKPIIGCEMYITANDLHSKNPTAEDRKRHHLILLVKNEEGYHNLMKLVSIAHLDGFYYKPRIDRKVLRQYAKGLVGLSACAEGEIPVAIITGDYEKAKNLALEYKDIFDEGNFFLEVQDHPNFEPQKIANKGIFKLAKELDLPVVATCDVHYVRKEDAPAQDILLCVQTNRKVDETNRMNLMDFNLSLRSPEEVLAGFPDNPEVLSNTQKVVDLCEFKLKLGETKLPHFDVPEGHTPMSFLRQMCEEGLKKRFEENDITKEHRDRMEYELSVIEKTGYASYFLIVQDFVNWAKDNGIVTGPGRGSAAGSFVSYLVGITNMDPIKYDLLFERFLNPERISMPDVDMDFADDKREEVLDYVRRRYGNDHVAQIITFGTMAARAAIRDTGRALGFPYDFCDKTAKLIPMFSSISKALEEVKEFKDLYDSGPDAKKLIDNAMRLEGVVRHAGMHACGVVITPEPVTEYSPLQKIQGKGEGCVTQYSSSTKSSFVEKIGLLKMDFLGLKNLTIIQNTLRIVKKTRGLDVDIDKIPLNDDLAFGLLQKAQTTGVFQLESSGMKRYLKLLKPNDLEDVIAMVALYRPGPMDWIPDFIARKHGEKKITYLHPKLEPILGKTYGVAVYQEQIMQIAQALAGFTLGEADVLRKAVGKKIFDLIREQKIKFVEGCVANGITKKVAEEVFAYIEPFAGYGFNRSHAACYGLIGYQTAYLKAHFPAEFMAALLTSDQDDIDRVAIEVSECREMGIEVLPPDVNESFEEFAVIKDPDGKTKIRFGLNAIKNVGRTVAHEIVEERKRNGKFKSLRDLAERVETKDLNKKSIEALAKVGALDEMGERNQIIQSTENIIAHIKNFNNVRNSAQISLFGDIESTLPEIQLVAAIPADKKQRLAWEKELMGLYISDHPMHEYKEYFEHMAVPLKNIGNHLAGKSVNLGGIITKTKKIYLKTGKAMMFVTIEDTESSIEFIVFPKILEESASLWVEDKIILASGKISDKDGSAKFLVDSASAVNNQEVERFRRVLETRKANGDAFVPKSNAPEAFIEVILPADIEPSSIKKLSEYFAGSEKGGAKIYLWISGKKVKTNYSIAPSEKIGEELASIIPEAKLKMSA